MISMQLVDPEISFSSFDIISFCPAHSGNRIYNQILNHVRICFFAAIISVCVCLRHDAFLFTIYFFNPSVSQIEYRIAD